MNINTSQEILRLRNVLQGISNISFSFSKLNQKYPIDTLTEEDGKEMLIFYKNLIKDAQKIIDNTVEAQLPI